MNPKTPQPFVLVRERNGINTECQAPDDGEGASGSTAGGGLLAAAWFGWMVSDKP